MSVGSVNPNDSTPPPPSTAGRGSPVEQTADKVDILIQNRGLVSSVLAMGPTSAFAQTRRVLIEGPWGKDRQKKSYYMEIQNFVGAPISDEELIELGTQILNQFHQSAANENQRTQLFEYPQGMDLISDEGGKTILQPKGAKPDEISLASRKIELNSEYSTLLANNTIFQNLKNSAKISYKLEQSRYSKPSSPPQLPAPPVIPPAPTDRLPAIQQSNFNCWSATAVQIFINRFKEVLKEGLQKRSQNLEIMIKHLTELQGDQENILKDATVGNPIEKSAIENATNTIRDAQFQITELQEALTKTKTTEKLIQYFNSDLSDTDKLIKICTEIHGDFGTNIPPNAPGDPADILTILLSFIYPSSPLIRNEEINKKKNELPFRLLIDTKTGSQCSNSLVLFPPPPEVRTDVLAFADLIAALNQTILEYPDILILQMPEPPEVISGIPLELELDDHHYFLEAASEHSPGHYTAVVKRSDDSWNKIDTLKKSKPEIFDLDQNFLRPMMARTVIFRKQESPPSAPR